MFETPTRLLHYTGVAFNVELRRGAKVIRLDEATLPSFKSYKLACGAGEHDFANHLVALQREAAAWYDQYAEGLLGF